MRTIHLSNLATPAWKLSILSSSSGLTFQTLTISPDFDNWQVVSISNSLIRVPRPLFPLHSEGRHAFFFCFIFSICCHILNVFIAFHSLLSSWEWEANEIQEEQHKYNLIPEENFNSYFLKMCSRTIFITTLILFWVKCENVCKILQRAQNTVWIEGSVIMIPGHRLLLRCVVLFHRDSKVDMSSYNWSKGNN